MLTNEDDVEEEGDSDSQTLLNSHSPSCWGKIKQLRPRYQILIVMIGLLMLSAIVTGIIVYCWPKKGKYSPGYVKQTRTFFFVLVTSTRVRNCFFMTCFICGIDPSLCLALLSKLVSLLVPVV